MYCKGKNRGADDGAALIGVFCGGALAKAAEQSDI